MGITQVATASCTVCLPLSSSLLLSLPVIGNCNALKIEQWIVVFVAVAAATATAAS